MGQVVSDKPPAAILHSEGGVWVNGYEAHDSSAVFPGDVIETKTGSPANLSLEGSTILIAPESVSKFQGDLLELDHGGVSVTTSRTFKVRVNCILVVPILNQWTQYVVTDLNGTVQVAARKLDVNVERRQGQGTPEPQPSEERASVHEGEEKNYDEAEICGSTRPTTAAKGISPKWIAGGAAGAGILIWLLIHGGGGKTPVSPSTP